MVELSEPLTLEQQKIENAKKGILAIEGLFFAVNSTTFSPRFMDGLRVGLEFLSKLHELYLADLGQDEVQKLRNQFKTQNVPPPTVPPAPIGIA